MPRRTDRPQPGFYTLRLVRGGPPVGAEIIHDENGQWWCSVDDVLYGPAADPFQIDALCQVHAYGQDASEAEVRYRVNLKRWAVAYSPSHPSANPRRPINSDQLLPF